MGKHKKHKLEKRSRYDDDSDGKGPSLKLILKVGGQATPEHSMDWNDPTIIKESNSLLAANPLQQEQLLFATLHRFHHKKSKKKKKKKEKNKDKDRERKHKHHHKEKKKKRAESSQDEGSLEEVNMNTNVTSPSGREPRLCVLRKREEKTSLQRALEHVLKALEKRDPQQFFAWPVTDNIAPGYSAIISHPMDFNTMRQKIEENEYATLQHFISDFKLVCNNAMQYNHIDTVYYKAAKKLLHAGMKLLQPEKLGWLLNLIPELSSKELGFEITAELRQNQKDGAAQQEREEREEGTDNDAEKDKETTAHQGVGGAGGEAMMMTMKKKIMPSSKFEAIPDCLTPEAILEKAQKAAREAKEKLEAKNGATLGFLRMKKDGSTYLNIVCGGDGVVPGTKKRPVSLGQLTGKLTEGSSHLQGFREDRRNMAKPVKPLYYGAFGSYAPSYDSTFANLTKEESELVYQTYGSETAVQYAESILDFAKDCDYTLHMVDSLLDLLTGGEHSKTKVVLEEKKSIKEEEEAIKTVLENESVDFKQLKTLSSLGIDTSFLDELEKTIEGEKMEKKLETTSQLLNKLQKTQYKRLSAPLPQHLNNVPPPGDEEIALADSVTQNLTDMAKKVNPSDVGSVQGIRKALGVDLPAILNEQVDENDLETELRQFLECETSLNQSPDDDKTIEEILME